MLTQKIGYKLPHGSQACCLPYECLDEIKRDVDALRSSNYASPLIETVARDFYHFDEHEAAFRARSILIAASLAPLVNVEFVWNGQRHRCYTDGCALNEKFSDEVETELCAQMAHAGHHLKRHDGLPLKQLAARSGLGEYGRNNLIYVEGLGSFIKLTAYLTDMPCTSEMQPIRRMAHCEECGVCMRHCPGKAITPNRTVIDAQRCLTYFNEFIDLAPFPDWLPTSSHNSVHGCMMCQVRCPKNQPFLQHAVTPVSFTERETSILLEGREMEALPQALGEKVNALNLEEYLPLLPRNLMAIFER